MSDNYLLKLSNICKSFSGVKVLEGVNLNIRAGTCHVLAGENGAGKSTLIKMICGYHQPTSGEMLLDNNLFLPKTPFDAISLGINAVYQELNLLPNLSVAENLFFDNLPRNTFGFVDKKKLYAQTKEALAQFDLDINPDTPVSQLGIAYMQMIEIIKALSKNGRLLILDEPTATLTPKEIEKLFAILKRLKAQGVTLIYISHRLNELKEIGDDISILRNGVVVKSCPINEISTEEMIKEMIGRQMEEEYPFDETIQIGETIFEAKNITTNKIKNINISAKQGEILGIAGLVGAGRTEFLRAIFGADKKSTGELFINGERKIIKNPKDAVHCGINFVSEDRKHQGLVLDFEIFKNISLTTIKEYAKGGVLEQDLERKDSNHYRDLLNIKSSSVEQKAVNLSGGNQQKVIFAKWLKAAGNILLLDEPTRGIDVGAKYEIYLLLNELAKQGKAIIVVSSDIHELMGICHRIVVMSNGEISGELMREQFDSTKLLSLSYQNYLS